MKLQNKKDHQRALGFMAMVVDLGGRKPSAFSRIFTAIGSGAAIVMAAILYAYQDSPNPPDLAQKLGAGSFMVLLLVVFVLGVRYLAIGRSGSASVKSVGGVFWRVFLWMYLPAIILTIILTSVALLLRGDR